MAVSRKLAQGAMLTLALGAVIVLAVGGWRAKGRQTTPVVAAEEPSSADIKLTDMEYTEMRDGRRLWTIKAEEARYFKEEQKTALSSVLLTFFLEDGSEILLKGHQGLLYAGTKNIELWESVRADLPQGFRIDTERVFYEHDQQTVSSDKGIRISGPELQVRGDRWRYGIVEKKATVEGMVQAAVAFLPPKTESKE